MSRKTGPLGVPGGTRTVPAPLIVILFSEWLLLMCSGYFVSSTYDWHPGQKIAELVGVSDMVFTPVFVAVLTLCLTVLHVPVFPLDALL